MGSCNHKEQPVIPGYQDRRAVLPSSLKPKNRVWRKQRLEKLHTGIQKMKRRLAVMQMRRWDWALQPRTLTFLINDGAVPKQWQLTDTVRLCAHLTLGGGNYTQVQSRSSKACMGVTQKHILIYTRKLVVQIRLIRPRHDLKTATVTCYSHSAGNSGWRPQHAQDECNWLQSTFDRCCLWLLRSQRSGLRALSARHWWIWCIDMVMIPLTLKMCCTETGDAAITSSFHKLTAAQSPHTQKLSDGHVSPWNVFFYCTCHESVDVDKDTWITQCKNKQMFEAVNKTPA